MQQEKQHNDSPGLRIILNGQELRVDHTLITETDSVVSSLLSGCDDIYEQIVTPGLIEKIREEACLELIYTEVQKVALANSSELSFSKIIIPLSGKFRQGDELVFICGNPAYESPPYANSKGFQLMKKTLEKLNN